MLADLADPNRHTDLTAEGGTDKHTVAEGKDTGEAAVVEEPISLHKEIATHAAGGTENGETEPVQKEEKGDNSNQWAQVEGPTLWLQRLLPEEDTTWLWPGVCDFVPSPVYALYSHADIETYVG